MFAFLGVTRFISDFYMPREMCDRLRCKVQNRQLAAQLDQHGIRSAAVT